MEHKNDYAQAGGSRHHFLPAGRRFGGGRAGLILLSVDLTTSRVFLRLSDLRIHGAAFALGLLKN
jgi:hypothetical protein